MTYTRHSGTGVSTDDQEESVFIDEFRPAGPDREPAGLPPGWLTRPAAGLAAGDGIARVTPEGLVVAPPGRDPATGRPRFAALASLDAASHLRWVAFAGTAAPPGFALRDGSVLTARMELAAEIYGPAVRVPTGSASVSGTGIADTRAGMGGMLCVDLGSGLVLDFLLTNDRVWVLYERLGRPGTGHGTFTYEIPVAERSPDRRHQCAVRVDRARGTAVWSLDGQEVFAVPDLGHRLPSRSAHLTRSTDGPEESVRPDRLALGIGLFSEIPEFSGVRVTVRRATVSRSVPAR